MKKILFILTFLFVAVQWSFSQNDMKEVVYLKNGSIIKGIIIEQIPNKSLKIETADGSIFVCDINDVEKITKERIRSSSRSSGSSTTELGSELTASGYKGFVDLGYTAGVGDYSAGRMELTTSHGYQFNPYLFLGAGTGFQYYHEGETFTLPIFADIRANFMKGPIVPFVGFKAGYTLAFFDGISGLGAYLAPNVGVKFAVSPNTALNFTLGYTGQIAKIEYYDSYDYYSGHITLSGISFKIGLEF